VVEGNAKAYHCENGLLLPQNISYLALCELMEAGVRKAVRAYVHKMKLVPLPVQCKSSLKVSLHKPAAFYNKEDLSCSPPSILFGGKCMDRTANKHLWKINTFPSFPSSLPLSVYLIQHPASELLSLYQKKDERVVG
jgi:hypothetical protein